MSQPAQPFAFNVSYCIEDQYTFFIISRSFLLIMRNVSDKSCRVNQNVHFVFGNFFNSKIVPFMRKCGKNIVETGQATYDNMAHAQCMLDT
jgi:hypothetical protein